MTAHTEMFHAANLLCEAKGSDEITPKEIISLLKCVKSSHPETDIRTEMRRCCVDSPRHHYTKHDYFKEIERGRYRLIKK